MNFHIKNRKTSIVLIGIAGFIAVPNAMADGFDRFGSQIDKLSDQAILVAGNISKRLQYIDYLNNNSGLNSQKKEIYEIGGYCFSSNTSSDISEKAGMLLVDRFSIPSIAVMSYSISSIKVDVSGITILDCISLSRQEQAQFSDQLKHQLEALKMKRELLDQMLKNRQSQKIKP